MKTSEAATIPDISEEERAFQEIRRRSRDVEKRILAEEGGSVSSNQFARKLGASREIVGRLRNGNHILGVLRSGRFVYPVWQIHEKSLLPLLHTVIELLGEQDSLSKVAYFLTQLEGLGDKRPLDVLRNGTPSEIDYLLVHAGYRECDQSWYFLPKEVGRLAKQLSSATKDKVPNLVRDYVERVYGNENCGH